MSFTIYARGLISELEILSAGFVVRDY